MNVAEIRARFVRFFEQRGHTPVASSSLIPAGDPTLLFTNSGMMQFKDVFLGQAVREDKTAVTVQRCLRAGGKHNDLENVGYTARHHTFFEMLGNFSFGDYFKEKAIPYAWEFLTSPQWLGIAPAHLWITVYGGGRVYGEDSPQIPADDEARDIWTQTLMAAGWTREQAEARIINIPTTDNFWMMGNTGPCGPCSEIFYDKDAQADRFRGEDLEHADTCVEIWNLVFMQYNRTDAGELLALPAPCIDTGMGLERISAVMQGVDSNYKTDLFNDLIAALHAVAAGEGGGAANAKSGKAAADVTPSHYVVSDHIRAAAMLIADGIAPSNEGRGYVLRRIIRRALRHLQKIRPSDAPRFCQLVAPLVALMGDSHPVLVEHQTLITDTLRREEEQFTSLLKTGMALLADAVSSRPAADAKRPLPGEVVFKLYDTYGFPPDMTANIAREDYGLDINDAEFEKCMEAQRARSRSAMKFKISEKAIVYDGTASEFIGYNALSGEARIAGIFREDAAITEVRGGDRILVVLNRTPFYGESGGQIGDIGTLTTAGGATIHIVDTQKIRADVWGHLGVVSNEGVGDMRVCNGDEVFCQVDANHRAQVTRAHSAAHLLHAALHEVLGKHATQRGSRVANDNLRFDFAHNQAVTAEELKTIEDLINHHIICNHAIGSEEMAFDDAQKRGAMALFGEKYGARVRVVTIAEPFSVELCGGTHVAHSGDIGLFQFVGESAIAGGVRRVEAVCAYDAFAQVHQMREQIQHLAQTLKTPANRLAEKITSLQDAVKSAEKQIAQLQAGQLREQIRTLATQAKSIGEGDAAARYIICEVPAADGKHLRDLAAQLSAQLAPAVVLLASGSGGVAHLAAASTATNINANDLLQAAATVCGAKGGGREKLAQAGGGDASKISTALTQAHHHLTA